MNYNKIQQRDKSSQLRFFYKKLTEKNITPILSPANIQEISTFSKFLGLNFHFLKEDLEGFETQPNSQNLERIIVKIERFLKQERQETEFLVQREDRVEKIKEFPFVVILDQLRSSFNVGSIFRTCDSLGVSELALCGYTSTPENKKTLKTTMGTHHYVSWKSFSNTLKAIQYYKKQNYKICALETTPYAENIYDFTVEEPLALVVGNERFGVSPEGLAECETLIEIPQWGRKNSMNVSVALGIALSHIVKQWEGRKNEY